MQKVQTVKNSGPTQYKEAQSSVWFGLILADWKDAATLLKKAGLPELDLPNFAIASQHRTRYGAWYPERRVLEISEAVFRNHNAAARIEVLRHEVAHQAVTDFGLAPVNEAAHGDTWKSYCHILGCRPMAKTCDEVLDHIVHPAHKKRLDKVRKLIVHGENAGSTQAEAEVFLQKARQLMLDNNLSPTDLDPNTLTDSNYVKRPVGQLFKRLPGYYHLLGNLLADHYYVNYIQTWDKVAVGNNIENRTRIELFGELGNVDVAEYVCHQLLNQADALYRSVKPLLAKASKRDFMCGLFEGYEQTLLANKTSAEETMGPASRELIRIEGELRNRFYHEAYPRLRSSKVYTRHSQSHALGVEAGRNLKVKKGVHGTQEQGKKGISN